MLDLTKRQTTKNYVEFCFNVPASKAKIVETIIKNLFTLAGLTSSAKEVESDETISLDEMFPDIHNGSAIKGLRFRENLTQTKLAELINIKRYQISEMENGKRPIDVKMAKKLARALNSDFRVFCSKALH